MADPTDAEIEAGAEALRDAYQECWGHEGVAADMLRAVLPDHDARVRARVAEEIAQALETHKRRSGGQPPATTILHEAAAIARRHATPPTEETLT